MDRFWSKVKKTSTCWHWTGAKDRDGYGVFGLNGDTHKAHRLAWQLTNGRIPKNKCLLHICNSRKCVNPQHLFIGSQAENIADMVSKNRQAKGTKLPIAKLNRKYVKEIKKKYQLGDITQTQLAEIYGVTQSTIWHCLQGFTWRHA